MPERIECLVVGGGAVGLGIGRAFARAGRAVIVLEANPWIGNETSSRNNEIIHTGFMYRPRSLRSNLCPQACDELYAYCRTRGVRTVNSGKLFFAVRDDDVAILETFKRRADEVGVDGVELIDSKHARELEPELHCIAALESKKSGVVDSHGLMLAYQGEIEDGGGSIALNSRALGGRLTASGFEVDVKIGDGTVFALACDILVNAAGLGAQAFATRLEGYPRASVPSLFFGKGCFFSLSGKPPFARHISPVRDTLDRGGAFTLDLGGRAKFGPDFEVVEHLDYSVDAARRARFAEAIRGYYPAIDEHRLHPDYAGIRPLLKPHRDILHDDWMIEGPAQHGQPNLVHLFGMNTPALTASLTIGDYVRNLIA